VSNNRFQLALPKPLAGASLAILLCALCGACRTASSSAKNAALEALLSEQSYVKIAPGSFLMGSPETEPSKEGRELRSRPQRRVTLTRGFELGKYEVTQAQWEAVMGANPSQFKGANLPVETVSWRDAQDFIARLQPLAGNYVYRLPTEAEWEYACRAGSTGDFTGRNYEEEMVDEIPGGEKTKGLTKEALAEQRRKAFKASEAYHQPLLQLGWFASNSQVRTHPVGEKKPNAWGLYDLHGNVWEWCADWFQADYYSTAPATDPPGPGTGEAKVNRGGSWQVPPSLCRVWLRGFDRPTERGAMIGFRLARSTK
jgi:formylglycine-generating enzyme required for sulfatase activity